MAGAKARTPDVEDGTKQPPDWNLPDEAPEMPDVPLLPPTDTGRLKSVAGVQDVDPVHILKKVSGLLLSATEAFVADVAIYYHRVAQGTQAPGKVSNHIHKMLKPLEIGSLLSSEMLYTCQIFENKYTYLKNGYLFEGSDT